MQFLDARRLTGPNLLFDNHGSVLDVACSDAGAERLARYTREAFGDFELRLEARLRGEGQNAGVQFRSARIPNDHEVIGYQCDMGRMDGRLIWGALYDESRRRRMLAELIKC